MGRAIDESNVLKAINNMIAENDSVYVTSALRNLEVLVKELPSVQPYTDEEIQKMQDMEQAQLDKAFGLGREDAQPEIIHCKDCRWQKDQSESTAWLPCRAIVTPSDFYCGRAERRTDE